MFLSILFSLLILAPAHTPAPTPNQNAILTRIANTNKNTRTLQASFDQIRTLANKKTVTMSGMLYYTAANKMDMVYSQPKGDRFCINGNAMNITNNGNTKKYDLAKTASMKSLANSLLWAMNGQVEQIAQANNADISVEESNGEYVVTLTAKKRQTKGYAKLVITYGKKDCIIRSLTLEEFSHIINTYTLLGTKTNKTLPSTAFAR